MATQISHDVGLAPIRYTGLKAFPIMYSHDQQKKIQYPNTSQQNLNNTTPYIKVNCGIKSDDRSSRSFQKRYTEHIKSYHTNTSKKISEHTLNINHVYAYIGTNLITYTLPKDRKTNSGEQDKIYRQYKQLQISVLNDHVHYKTPHSLTRHTRLLCQYLC